MRITCRLSVVVKFAIFLLVLGLVAGFYLGNRSATAGPATSGTTGHGARYSATVGYAHPPILQ